MKKPEAFIELLRRRQASISVAASTARGMGPSGTVQAARDSLAALDLKAFCCKNEKDFLRALDKATEKVRGKLISGYQYWGAARKFVNIFLRGCTYNKYLCAWYNLKHIESYLEVPLDSHVYRGLKVDGAKLGSWPGVIHLQKSTSNKCQEWAKAIGLQKKINRVDLDVEYWRRAVVR